MGWVVCAGGVDRADSPPKSSHHENVTMRTLIQSSIAAALVAFGVGPAMGQSAPAKDEKKVAEERQKAAEETLRFARERQEALQKLKADAEKKAVDERKASEERVRSHAREVQDTHLKLKAELEARARELEKLRDQLADEAKKKADVVKEGVLSKPLPPQPATGVVRWGLAEQQATDPLAAIKPLIRSDDPKVAALAAQLAELLAKKAATTPKPAVGVVEVGGKLVAGGGPIKRPEVKTGSEPLKVVVVTDKSASTDKTAKVPESYASLRMSADGKTAAVTAADGSVTVFDTASGKELMRFPVKK
jgi:phage-related minor tail protein